MTAWRSSTAGRRAACRPCTTPSGARLELGDVKHLLLSHIHLDHAGAAGALVREHPAARRPRVGGRRAAHRRPEPARGERAQALRRLLRRAVGRARARAGGERPRRRRAGRWACLLPDAGPRVAPGLLPARGRHALQRRRGRGADCDPGRFVFAPTPPPEIDLDAWERTTGRDRAALTARGSRSCTSACSTTSSATWVRCARRCAAGRTGSATGWTSRPSSPPRGRTSPPPTRRRRTRTTAPRRTGTATSVSSGTGASGSRRSRRARPRVDRRRRVVEGLERIALAAYLPVYGDDAMAIGEAVCLSAPHAPDSPMLNRVVGLGLGAQVEEATLDRCLAAMADTTFYVAVAPSADPRLVALLDERGLEQGWGWMLFERAPRARPARRDGARRRREVDAGRAEVWAELVTTSYGLPDASAARRRGRPLASRAGPRSSPWTATSRPPPRPSGSAGRQRTSGSPQRSPSTGGRVGRERCSPRGSSGPGRLAARTLVTETGELRDERPERVLPEHPSVRHSRTRHVVRATACVGTRPGLSQASPPACVGDRRGRELEGEAHASPRGRRAAATPASSASCQRPAHRHQRSPGTRPPNPCSGRGVERSLPTDALNSRKSSVMTAQTA